MIQFKEWQINGYRARTIENCRQGDITIAFANDFSTYGERLTHESTIKAKREYIQIPINRSENHGYIFIEKELKEKVINKIRDLRKANITLNIAGNGIYTFKNLGLNINQDKLDSVIIDFISSIVDNVGCTINIITGGQTGIDESGAKAGDKLGLNTTILAPKGWIFRDINGIDIYSEIEFKKRFHEDKNKEKSL